MGRAAINNALALTSLSEVSDMLVPLTAPPAIAGQQCASPGLTYLSYSSSDPFNAASLLAAAIDTALLPVWLAGDTLCRFQAKPGR